MGAWRCRTGSRKTKGCWGMVHSLVVEQCRLGPGYPVALKEAHEQAVVTGADRQYFVDLVADALEQQGLPVYSSEKNISKMRRWI